MADHSEEARLRAEAKFKKKQQQDAESDKVWAERAANEKAGDAKRARLKALRLAKEAADQVTSTENKPAPKPTKHKPAEPTVAGLAEAEQERGILPTHRPLSVKPARSPKVKT